MRLSITEISVVLGTPYASVSLLYSNYAYVVRVAARTCNVNIRKTEV
jgi:hypothetical protein